MTRASTSKVHQRNRHIRRPAHALIGDIDSQPRYVPTKFSHTQNLKKDRETSAAYRRQQSNTTFQLLTTRLCQDGCETDERAYEQAARDVDSDTFMGYDSGYNYAGGLSDLDNEEDGWVEEELSREEELLFHAAKDDLLDVHETHYRDRRNKRIIDQERWDAQMPELLEAFLEYLYTRAHPEVSTEPRQVRERHEMLVYDVFSHYTVNLDLYDSDKYQNTSWIRQGFLPFNALRNRAVICIHTVQLYHSLFVRCPRLGIQPFIRTLCDMQGIRFKNYLAILFSQAYDLYVALLNGVRRKVQVALGRDSENWRMLNACPACQYEVIDEPELILRMLIAVDGNDSMKRLERRQKVGGQVLGILKEWLEKRVGGGDYFMSSKEVDQWDQSNWAMWPGYQPPKGKLQQAPCSDGWSNMKEAKTKKAFGAFDETGIFTALCRHRFVLKLLDMIRTGEQSKYFLSFLYDFLTATKADRERRGLSKPRGSLGVGYDIACHLVNLLMRSPLGKMAEEEQVKLLVGILHGYGHKRLCQLDFLMIYILGAGNEDLEVCERFFSITNGLAPVVRHSSRFHRRQAIHEFVYHLDNFETYANLSKFIYNNYRDALKTLATAPTVAKTMKELQVASMETFVQWLKEEKDYLKSRQNARVDESLEILYYDKLVVLYTVSCSLEDARKAVRKTSKPGVVDEHQTKVMQLEDKLLKVLEAIHSLESEIGVLPQDRWKEGGREWREAEEKKNTVHYQKALDRLEGLIVARMFELARMNISGTGYKMRQHLSQAIKNRSAAIQTALNSYNSAASKLKPPRPHLEWKDVLDYSYLSEFDFLRDTRSDVREKPWAKPAARELMTKAFKLLRAEEELDRLHVEIKRLFTYMKEEDEYLKSMQDCYRFEDPRLAFQIDVFRQQRGRFNKLHRMRLCSIRKLKGFDPRNSNFFHPGVGVRRQTVDDILCRDSVDGGGSESEDDGEDNASEGEEEEIEAESMLETVLSLADDATPSVS